MLIYKVINLINGRVYIGKTITTLNERKYKHIYSSKSFSDMCVFHKAIRKYGIENFKWEVIYECDEVLILNVMETMKIIVNHSHVSENGYNLTWGGDGLPKGFKHTEETKKKMSISSKDVFFSNEHRKKLSDRAKNMSDEHKRKIVESRMGFKHTEESKKKMSISHIESMTDDIKIKISNSRKGKGMKYSFEVIEKAFLLSNNGLGYRKISKMLNIPIPTIQSWIRKKKRGYYKCA